MLVCCSCGCFNDDRTERTQLVFNALAISNYVGIEFNCFLLDNNLLLVDLIFWIDLLRILCWLIDL